MPAHGRHWAADPFVEAGQLAQGEINAIMDGLTRWEKLLAQLASASAAASLGYSNSDQDGDVAEQVDEARESLLGRLAGIDDQLSAFDDAIEAAAANPSQFHVSEEEIARRRQFVSALRFQTAHARKRLTAADPEAALFESMRHGKGASAVLSAPMDAATGATTAASFARDGTPISASRIQFVDRNEKAPTTGTAQGILAAVQNLVEQVSTALGPKGRLMLLAAFALTLFVWLFARFVRAVSQ